MSQRNDVSLNFSGLFKLDVLVQLEISAYSFYEVGLKKFLAVSSDKELVFLYINAQGERFDHNYDWDFFDNPVHCLCFEPSGTWLMILSDDKVLLVPFLPLFIPQSTFDHKWSLTSVTVLPLGNVSKPTTVVWWLTKESENILIIGSKTGTISFYSLESQSVIGETKVSDEISDLQICFDDSLDLLTLLITGLKSQQWKLILEHRSFGYNWLQQSRSTTDINKRDSFMSYIKQLSKDKITLFTQGSSKDNKPQTVEYVLKPTEYLPVFRKGSNNWALTAQYVNGRHFLTAFEVNEGTLILESPEQDRLPSRTLRPIVKKDGLYTQGLWSQRLIYLLRNNQLEVHSSAFSVIQGEGLLGTKDHTILWTADLIGSVRRAFLVSTREPPSAAGGWKEPTFMCDLQLPRFNLEQCLVITASGAFLLNTVSEPSEWLVGMIMRGGVGAEQSAAALGAPVPVLLRAAADMLLSRGKLAPAQYLYSLSQCQPDGWVARLGVFGRLQELSMYKPAAGGSALGTAAQTIKLLALLLKVNNNTEEKFDTTVKLTNLTTAELEELCSISAAVGLWDLVPIFSIHRGNPNLLLTAIRTRGDMCRGAINCLLRQRCVVPILLEENGQWLFDFITEKCNKFDTRILKCLALWLCPLQDQLSPVMRDLKQGITTVYTTRIQQLISTFAHVVSAIEARAPSPEINPEIPQPAETWINNFVPRRAVSAGLAHWAVLDDGGVKVMLANTQVNTELCGRAVAVSCGRHHTLVATENGVYAAGDNTYGQLGVGSHWPGATGDNANPSGALMYVPFSWPAPVVSVAAGHYHSAALDVGGRLYTWGWGVHGQLGLGTIDDEWTPQLVTKLQGRKVLSVGCGACHTAVLMKNGSVFVFGAAVFGQLGGGNREKSSVPIQVPLTDKIEAIAVGYFHNLALTSKGQLYCWGGSPQNVRAAHARRSASPSAPSSDPPVDPHLVPAAVDMCNVRGKVVQMSAGWHHSCIVDNAGNLYTWGLNFDGQLGAGDRKQIQIPTEIKINRDTPVDASNEPSSGIKTHTGIKSNTKPPEIDIEGTTTKSLVACGGDFTIFIDDEGRIYAAGNTHQELNVNVNKDYTKAANRVIMMKTTKRVIKIPASRNNNKFLCFSSIDRVDIMFPFDVDNLHRTTIKPHQNPLKTLADFKRKSWPDEIIIALKSWIKEDYLIGNQNMAAKLAYHNQKYSECLRLLLDNLKYHRLDDTLYLSHTEIADDLNTSAAHSSKKDELKIVISNVMSKRIKEISLNILNEQSYPTIDPTIYKSLPCCCDELKYLPKKAISTSAINITEQDLSIQAANIIDKCMSIFPVDSELWETCFRFSKNFFLDNDLSVVELESVLRKYMELNASAMASAIMYSNDCVQYSKILSPKFYLNMCSEIMDAWS